VLSAYAAGAWTRAARTTPATTMSARRICTPPLPWCSTRCQEHRRAPVADPREIRRRTHSSSRPRSPRGQGPIRTNALGPPTLGMTTEDLKLCDHVRSSEIGNG
jgi:hypothetical protein